MEQDFRTSLIDMEGGGFKEVIDYEVSKVVDNIMDVNTKATAKRKVTVSMEFLPDDSRQIESRPWRCEHHGRQT